MRILLLLPPMIQFNTPYPSTSYLTGFLKSKNFEATQADISVLTVDYFLSPAGLQEIYEELITFPLSARMNNLAVSHFITNFETIRDKAPILLEFLKGKHKYLQLKILSGNLVPPGPNQDKYFKEDQDTAKRFSEIDEYDQALSMAGMFFADIFQVLEFIDSDFVINRYAEKLAFAVCILDPLLDKLMQPTLISKVIERITLQVVQDADPDIVGVSVPFDGNVFGSLLCSRVVKTNFPDIRTVMGGGFCNTSMRELSDPRIFDFFDFITLDDGEKPLLNIIENMRGERPKDQLLRTFYRNAENKVVYATTDEHDIPQIATGRPTFAGLDLTKYFMDLTQLQALNPLNALMNSVRWNKLTIAHGCYWRKCTFCDINLDYIGRYDFAGADVIVDKIKALIDETGSNAFHFVDEACPPTAMAAISKRLIERNIEIVWVGNIRFDKTFTPRLTKMLAQAGCIAVTGGLEVASDRILKLMDKGTTIQQVVNVASAFKKAGVYVHTYLIYGFPTQTLQEIVDSLEIVRQLLKHNLIDAGYWHRFSTTLHSPIGQDPEKYGLQIRRVDKSKLPNGLFSEYLIAHKDTTVEESVMRDLGNGLHKALISYSTGIGIDYDLQRWFDCEIPNTTIDPDFMIQIAPNDTKKERVSQEIRI